MASSPHQPNHKAKYPLQPKYPGPDLLLPSKIGTHAGPGKDLLIQTHVFIQTSIATSSKLSSQIWPPDETPNTPSCCHQAQSTLGSHNPTRQKKKGCDIAYYPLNTALWSSPTIKLPSIGASIAHHKYIGSYDFLSPLLPLSSRFLHMLPHHLSHTRIVLEDSLTSFVMSSS